MQAEGKSEAFIDRLAIVLAGSLSVGEGQVDFMSGHPVILSDYDLIVVSRNVSSLWPPAAHRRLASTLEVIPFSIRLDISLVWEPLLRKRMTTISGSVIGGALDISNILTSMPGQSINAANLRGLRIIAEAWRLGQLDHKGERKAKQLAQCLCRVRLADINVDPMAAYVDVRDLLASLAVFNPHQLYYGPRSVSI